MNHIYKSEIDDYIAILYLTKLEILSQYFPGWDHHFSSPFAMYESCNFSTYEQILATLFLNYYYHHYDNDEDDDDDGDDNENWWW